ncbi:hypothetical protein D3C83_16930 [compost metagenome]
MEAGAEPTITGSFAASCTALTWSTDSTPMTKIASTPQAAKAFARLTAPSVPSTFSAAVRPRMIVPGSRRAATAALSLPVISSSVISVSTPSACPKGVGSAVSSMLMPETPACSSSSTVRMALRALP